METGGRRKHTHPKRGVVHRDSRITSNAVVAAVLLAAATAGCTTDPAEPSIVVLKSVASTVAPYSRIDDIALVSADIACVIDTYEFRSVAQTGRGMSWGSSVGKAMVLESLAIYPRWSGERAGQWGSSISD